MKYKIKDEQTGGFFAGGHVFNSKKEILKQLISYHSADCDKRSLDKMTLDQILEFGEWSLI